MRKLLFAFLLLSGCGSATAGEAFMTVGKTTPAEHANPVGVAGLGYRLHGAYGTWDIQAVYVAPQDLYDGQIQDPGYPLLTVAKVWQYHGKFLAGTPELQMGLGVKEADRCNYNGEEHCNRRQPLPFSFHFGAGLEWSAMRIQLFHDSNDAMDSGPEKKNRGITWLTLTLRIKHERR